MVFSIEGVSKAFDDKIVLDSISIPDCTTGSCIALLGKNGAGKTTFFNFLIDMINVESGRIKIGNEIFTPDSTEWKRMIGVALLDAPLPEDFSGRDYLLFIGKLYDLKRQEIDVRAESLINFFFGDLSVLKKQVGSYSIGMKRKISICAAVLSDPKVLILDEPFSGLDVEAIELLRQFFKYYLNEKRLIFITSHNLGYIQDIVTRVVVLDEGRIKFDDSLSAFTNSGQKQLDQALFELLTIEPKSTSQLSWLNE